MTLRQITLLVFALSTPPLLAQEKSDGIYASQDRATQLSERITTVQKGGTITVWVDDCTYKDVKFEEKERHSRLYQDLAGLLGKFGLKLESAACPKMQSYTYATKYERSTLTVTASGPGGSKTVTVIVGPEEHFFIGLDLPGDKKTLKYDSATRTLQPKDDNPQLYLSLNYYFGDLAAKAPPEKVTTDRLSVKLLVLADSRPLDSVGVGVGYQLPKILGLDLNAISVFVGHFWTKQDAITDSGEVDVNGATAKTWRMGVTYDIGAGLKWLK